jgi:NADPH:quinone reductase-like Zn-dependent oxidoreductase
MGTMRAVVQHRYGSPEILQVTTVAAPVPGPGEVLVRVRAASLNPRDWHLMRGEPRVARLLDRRTFTREAPREPVRGTDFAGVVEAVGAGVTRCRPGDAVFGEAPAALAELLVTSEDLVTTLPPGLGFEAGAALPLAANTALTCLDSADLEPGQALLVNGASGGVGTLLVQLAHARGMHVTAVCSAANADLVHSFGARDVIDHHRHDFTRTGQRYDAVVDLVGNRALRDLGRAVRPAGTLVLSGGGVSGQGRFVGPLGTILRAQLLRPFVRHRLVAPLAVPTRERLDELRELVRSEVLTPVVDRVFTLDEAAEAVAYLETARARGKVVIAVAA